MKVLFLSISTAVSDINNRGIYPDLLRYISNQGHDVFIVCPFERKTKKKTRLLQNGNVNILGVKTLNITKTNFLEKTLATLLIEKQYNTAINKHFSGYSFDLILYTTPPITFNNLIEKLKLKHNARTFLMLKDIFPQNAADLCIMKENGMIYNFFRSKEKVLYRISDFIGCMSQANVNYLYKNDPEIKRDKIVICPNAIELKNRELSNKNSILNRYKIPNNIPIFLYGGNLGVPQGIPNLIKVLERNQSRKDCFFLIIGSGNKSNLIVDFIQKGNFDNILYIPMLERIDYDELEACCDIGMIFLDHRFTIPNFPSRMLAYLECKHPLLIATDENTDIGKIAVENNFGTWSNSNDIDSICSSIDFFIKNPLKRKEMGQNGYDFLVKNYQVSNAYKSIFDKFN